MFDSDRAVLSAAFRALAELCKMPVIIFENRQRELAYHLWEQAGRPDGRSNEFWFQAGDILRSKVDCK